MKWEIYQKMTPSDKEEWTFKFKDNDWPISGHFIYLMIVWSTISLFILIDFIMMKQWLEGYENYMPLFTQAASISGAILVVWIIEIALKIGIYIYNEWKANKWLKQKGYK